MRNISSSIHKEWGRFKRRFSASAANQKDISLLQDRLANQPYELYENFRQGKLALEIPKIKNADETVQKILLDKCSLARFGDGEFSLMKGGSIHFQKSSPQLAARLKEVIVADIPGLLVALPDCFGSLDVFTPQVADFWRKWLSKKRHEFYALLDMDRIYGSAFFTRAFMPYNKSESLYLHCDTYFKNIKKIWKDRNVVICEGEGTRFGLFNDLLQDANSIRRIICPAENAYSKYAEILSAVSDLPTETLVLAALGPTATVLAYDMTARGFQAIDIGHLDVEYEWFLRKDEKGGPIENKYVDGSREGRKIHKLDNTAYDAQIIRKIL